VIGLFALFILWVFFLIFFNLVKKRESHFSTLLRIVMNYIQVSAAALSFEFQFPKELLAIFTPVKEFG